MREDSRDSDTIGLTDGDTIFLSLTNSIEIVSVSSDGDSNDGRSNDGDSNDGRSSDHSKLDFGDEEPSEAEIAADADKVRTSK